MIISNIHIENFRNIKKADVAFGTINIFTGKNSSGKSNLLLALSNSLKTDPDFSVDFFDNIVTHGRGMSKSVFRTTLSEINTKTIFYQPEASLYFAPKKFVFENTISKRNSASSLHTLYYWGEFGKGNPSLGVDTNFAVEEEDFRKSPDYKISEEEIVYEKNFEEQIETTDDQQLVKKLEERKFENESNYFSLFLDYANSIYSWARPKDFSSSVIYKHVTETYESEVREQVINRLSPREVEPFRKSVVAFSKAKFIFLLADVQRDEKQRELFRHDLELYTDKIIKNVKINTDGSQGTKGEIWVESPNNPKDISAISAGTAVLIYFILLKNWALLPINMQSFHRPEVMLFDEVDSIIHPSLINNFAEVLRSISKRIQIFITTHSSHFIDCFDKKQVFWLRDTTIDRGSRTASNIYSYEEILNRLQKNSDFFKKETNSKLFIDGLLDSVFPNVHE